MKRVFKWMIMIFPRIGLSLIKKYSLILTNLSGKDFSSQIFSNILIDLENRKQKIIHKKDQQSEISLNLYTPNEMCKMRADTFSTKEPEILKWIDEHGSESSFWDIGANIGLYSLYYAKSKPGSVISFEPSITLPALSLISLS